MGSSTEAFTLGAGENSQLRILGLTDHDIDHVRIVCEKKSLSRVTKENLAAIIFKVVYSVSLTGSKQGAKTAVNSTAKPHTGANTASDSSSSNKNQDNPSEESPGVSSKADSAPGVDSSEGDVVTDHNQNPVQTPGGPPDKERTGSSQEDCKHHLAGICKHPDAKCKYSHPVICSAFRKFAWKEGGCQKKKNECEHIHPKICWKAIKGRECKVKCMLMHPSGIQARQGSQVPPARQQQQQNGKTRERSQRVHPQQQQGHQEYQQRIEQHASQSRHQGQRSDQPAQHQQLANHQQPTWQQGQHQPSPQQTLQAPPQLVSQSGLPQHGAQHHQVGGSGPQPPAGSSQATSEHSFLEMRLEQMQAAILMRVQDIMFQQLQVLQKPVVPPPPGFPRLPVGYPGY